MGLPTQPVGLSPSVQRYTASDLNAPRDYQAPSVSLRRGYVKEHDHCWNYSVPGGSYLVKSVKELVNQLIHVT